VKDYKKITSKKSDGELDFNRLVVEQLNRCNLALCEPNSSIYYPKAVRAFSIMLAHLRQKCPIYKKDMTEITIKFRNGMEEIGTRKGMGGYKDKLAEDTAIAECEALVKLCARNNLFPSQRGELNDDDE
jgi:hypothetical protein